MLTVNLCEMCEAPIENVRIWEACPQTNNQELWICDDCHDAFSSWNERRDGTGLDRIMDIGRRAGRPFPQRIVLYFLAKSRK